ncbi:hypothetical protein SGFS_051670 [Streptomyces graminofaciens]|uniref:Secreted protein n=1 Tax=Streptomyces graminofaciens TaxID=68212 RepID=A0ABN5VL57_9ACTN|nr:hypothetical protein SGFS_051670 [Streptomyces graminofaciens]
MPVGVVPVGVSCGSLTLLMVFRAGGTGNLWNWVGGARVTCFPPVTQVTEAWRTKPFRFVDSRGIFVNVRNSFVRGAGSSGSPCPWRATGSLVTSNVQTE